MRGPLPVPPSPPSRGETVTKPLWYTPPPMDEQTGFNPKRRLCPDGTCTGILGPDGRCNECGRAGKNDAVGGAPASVFAVLDADDVPDENCEAPASRVAAETGPSDFDPNRRLCDDGACVGVIGPDAMCLVCGRAPRR